MVNGLYTASRSMINILAKQEVHSQNLANASSTGFKLSRLVNSTEVKVGRNDQNQLHQDEDQKIAGRYTAFTQGPLLKTGNDLDFALTNPGFFVIEGEEGTRYTRNGGFSLNPNGELVTLTGMRVLDENGSPIQLRGEGAVQLMEDGGVFRDGKRVTRLGVVEFPDNGKLLSGANGLFENREEGANPPAPAAHVGVR